MVHLEQPGQTENAALDYASKIVMLCGDIHEMEKLQNDSLNYVTKNCSLNAMREDIEKVLFEIFEEKYE